MFLELDECDLNNYQPIKITFYVKEIFETINNSSNSSGVIDYK